MTCQQDSAFNTAAATWPETARDTGEKHLSLDGASYPSTGNLPRVFPRQVYLI